MEKSLKEIVKFAKEVLDEGHSADQIFEGADFAASSINSSEEALRVSAWYFALAMKWKEEE